VIPAGNGYFAELLAGHDKDIDHHFGWLQCRTWISESMRDQVPTATSAVAGERLGANLLLPMPLRHLWAAPEVGAR
jgi:hypothetical protein